jgi:hypothetical protein
MKYYFGPLRKFPESGANPETKISTDNPACMHINEI